MNLGKLLILFGIILIGAGVLLIFFEKVFPLGRLPGDISIEKGNVKVYIPIMSAILISIILTLVINLLLFLFKR